MGEIYLARTQGVGGVDKRCAIKQLPKGLIYDDELIKRFLDEARTVSTLSHGNIAHVYEVGREGDAFFLVMEFVDGPDLRQVLARCFDRKVKIPLELGLYIMQELLQGLAYAHRKTDPEGKPLGLIHRDICPQNVMLSFEGEVKLIDFGLAKSALKTLATNPTILLGKVAYMSPEQAKREKLDRRSDLYSAGIVLYEVLSGRRRYPDKSQHDLLMLVRSPGPLILPPELSVPKSVEKILRKALEPRPEERYQTAEEFRRDLSSVLAELAPGVAPEQLGNFVRALFPREVAPTALTTPGRLPAASAPVATPPTPPTPQTPQTPAELHNPSTPDYQKEKTVTSALAPVFYESQDNPPDTLDQPAQRRNPAHDEDEFMAGATTPSIELPSDDFFEARAARRAAQRAQAAPAEAKETPSITEPGVSIPKNSPAPSISGMTTAQGMAPAVQAPEPAATIPIPRVQVPSAPTTPRATPPKATAPLVSTPAAPGDSLDAMVTQRQKPPTGEMRRPAAANGAPASTEAQEPAKPAEAPVPAAPAKRATPPDAKAPAPAAPPPAKKATPPDAKPTPKIEVNLPAPEPPKAAPVAAKPVAKPAPPVKPQEDEDLPRPSSGTEVISLSKLAPERPKKSGAVRVLLFLLLVPLFLALSLGVLVYVLDPSGAKTWIENPGADPGWPLRALADSLSAPKKEPPPPVVSSGPVVASAPASSQATSVPASTPTSKPAAPTSKPAEPALSPEAQKARDTARKRLDAALQKSELLVEDVEKLQTQYDSIEARAKKGDLTGIEKNVKEGLKLIGAFEVTPKFVKAKERRLREAAAKRVDEPEIKALLKKVEKASQAKKKNALLNELDALLKAPPK